MNLVMILKYVMLGIAVGVIGLLLYRKLKRKQMSLFIFDPAEANGTTSPIKHVWPHIPKALMALKAETRETLIATGVSVNVKFVDSPEFICHVRTTQAVVEMSTGFIQMLWVCSYLNFLYYDKWFRAGGLKKSFALDPNTDAELKAAMELFEWSLNAVFGKTPFTDWPDTLPQPLEDAGRNSWENFADELTLEAVGYVILHELAHVYLGHQGTNDSQLSINQEKEADVQAIDWLFRDTPEPHNGHRIKRSIAVASSLMMLCAFSLFTGDWGGKSHPPTWERLREVILQIANDEDHSVFVFLFLLLSLYRNMAGRAPIGSESFYSFLDGFEKFVLSMKAEHDARLVATS